MSHQINVDELRSWKGSQKVLYASSSKEQKRLYCTLGGSFEVHHKGEVVFETSVSYLAVQKYNEI